MEIPQFIHTTFTDANADSVRLKLPTLPFVSGSIDSVVNWMVANPLGNVDMEDKKTGATLFFLACKHNPSDKLIVWLIETGETKLDFVNSQGENVVEYLGKSAFNSPQIFSRIKLLLKYHSFDLDRKNKFQDSLFDIFAYSGYAGLIELVCAGGYVPNIDRVNRLIKQINDIITGQCDDYWSSDEVDSNFLLESLDKVIVVLQQIRYQ